MAKKYKYGTLIYDPVIERMDIRFGLNIYHGGLHCGECLDVLVNGEWIPTRIEKAQNWFLVDIRTDSLVGLQVRIE